MEKRNLKIDDLEIRAIDNNDSKMIIEGIVNTYKPSKKLYEESIGDFVETIPYEVWKECLDNSPNIELYLNHLPYVNMAKDIKVVADENEGVIFRAELHCNCKTLYNAIQNRKVNGLSFGFRALSNDIKNNPNGIKDRTVTKMRLFEISVLVNDDIPAHNFTDIGNTNITNDNLFKDATEGPTLDFRDQLDDLDNILKTLEFKGELLNMGL